jgi:hypothetical protein
MLSACSIHVVLKINEMRALTTALEGKGISMSLRLSPPLGGASKAGIFVIAGRPYSRYRIHINMIMIASLQGTAQSSTF